MMDDFWSHPAIQSGIIPFFAALPIIVILGKFAPKLMGLAVITAFIVTVGLVMGFDVMPFISTKKVILLTFLAAILGLMLDLAEAYWAAYRNYVLSVLALIAAFSVLWIIWPVIAREASVKSFSMAFGLCVYVFWMVLGISLASEKPEQVGSAVFAFSIGTAITCIAGATALYGQLVAPFAAATGAWMLYYLVKSRDVVFPVGFYLPAAFIGAILGAAATVYASVDWKALLFLALIPLVIRIPYRADSANWLKLLKSAVTALIPVLVTVWYTVRLAADSGY